MGKKEGEVEREDEYENAEGTNKKEGRIWEEKMIKNQIKKLDRKW